MFAGCSCGLTGVRIGRDKEIDKWGARFLFWFLFSVRDIDSGID